MLIIVACLKILVSIFLGLPFFIGTTFKAYLVSGRLVQEGGPERCFCLWIYS